MLLRIFILIIYFRLTLVDNIALSYRADKENVKKKKIRAGLY